MIKKQFLFLVICFVLVPSCFSSVTDNSDRLVVPAGETYSLGGFHSYTTEVRVDGILSVTGYSGVAGSGVLEISAPKIYVSSFGRITADMQGSGADSGQGKPTAYVGCSKGAGAGYGGLGGDSGSIKGGAAYGTFLTPVEIGSGGGSGVCGGASGGAGGGYLKLVADDLELYGVVSSTGGSGGSAWCYGCSYNGGGGGSGGSVIIETLKLHGTGSIIANGGNSSPYGGGGGSGGRLFVHSSDVSAYFGKISAWGGKGSQNGGAGTLVFNGTLVLDNNNVSGGRTPLPDGNYQLTGIQGKNRAEVEIPPEASFELQTGSIQSNSIFRSYGKLKFSGLFSLDNAILYHNGGNFNAASLRIGYGGQFYGDDKVLAGEITVSSGGVITHDIGDRDFYLEALRDIVVETGGKISTDGKGYGTDSGPGKPSLYSGCSRGAGGGYGGFGGDTGAIKGGAVYGSPLELDVVGSGGGRGHCGGAEGGGGGGIVNLTAGRNIVINGSVSANGAKGGASGCYQCPYDGGGGGSGGSVLLKAGLIDGTGTISADGGPGGWGNGGGGGGRVALYYNTKSFSGVVKANGAAQNGKIGTVLENGVVKGGASPGIDATAAITKATEILGAQTYLTETLASRYMSTSGAPATGTVTGSFDLNNLEVVQIKTGAFGGRGFAAGKFFASLSGNSYSGDLRTAVYERFGGLYLKGAVSGDIRGVIEAEIVNGRLTGKVKFSAIGAQNSAGELFLSGMVLDIQGAQFPATRISHIQSNVTGDMTGYLYYSGAINSVIDYIRVDDPSNPYYLKGFLSGSFKCNQGTAQGLAYADGLISGISSFNGMIGNPSYGMLGGVYLGNASPKAFAFNIERIDAGLPYGVELEVVANCPRAGSPWQTITCEITLTNSGLRSLENISVISRFPEFMDFVAASPGHNYYVFPHWVRDTSEPRTYVRWDLSSIQPKSTLKFNYQTKMRIGPLAHEMLNSDVYVLSIQNANAIFPVYTEEDYGEDY